MELGIEQLQRLKARNKVLGKGIGIWYFCNIKAGFGGRIIEQEWGREERMRW